MRVKSLNLGQPREVTYGEKVITTGIFKEPVFDSVRVGQTNLEGDGQADLKVHGGRYKAVYAYPYEHYKYWARELPEVDLVWGHFGENLTSEGLLEERVNIGDVYRVGTAELAVTQPRLPCFKLGVRFGRTDIIKRFLQSEKPGIYFSVLKEGQVQAGDSIELLKRDPQNVTVVDLLRLMLQGKDDPIPQNLELMKRALEIEHLPEKRRTEFQERLR